MDHVVAVAPGVGTLEIQFEAVGIGVANDVEPFGGPALAVGRGGEQAVDDLFVGVGRFVFQEGVDFGGRGRQAGEIEGDAADEAAAIERGGGLEVLFAQACEDEGVDGVADPGIAGGGHRRADDFLEGPVFGPGTDEGFVRVGLGEERLCSTQRRRERRGNAEKTKKSRDCFLCAAGSSARAHIDSSS